MFRKKLQQLESKNRLRALTLAGGIDLTSNDYLGLSTHPLLRAAAIEALQNGMPAGAGGSRLLRGNAPAHEALESFAAEYFGAEKSLFFSTGFAANSALFQALPTRHDVILYDALVHASVREGIKNSDAVSIKVPHNDLNGFESALKKHAGARGQIFLAVESVYSMDGDLAPLEGLCALAARYEAWLIVDEAHATGIFGADGKGLSEEIEYARMITLHTCGKALGVAGGLVCGPADAIDMMINRARAFVYSTAPPPLQALLVQKSLEVVQAEPERRLNLLDLRDYLNVLLEMRSPSQIFPVILGADVQALAAADFLQDHGFDVRAIRPPTVPEGTARLRVSLNINLKKSELDVFAGVLNDYRHKRAA